MSRVRTTKISAPSTPPANTQEVYYDTAGPGYLTPRALCAKDEGGVIAMLAHFATLDYRFQGCQTITATGGQTYTPTSGCRANFVEAVGAGGGSGSAAITSSNSSGAGGGGGGGYACGFVAAVSATVALNVPVGGIAGTSAGAGGNGLSDSTYAATTIVAKSATGGGAGSTAGATGRSAGGAGGIAGTAGTGGFTSVGSDGGDSVALSATQGFAGHGGSSFVAGETKGVWAAIATVVAGVVGKVYGGGASGTINIGTNASAGVAAAGAQGVIRIWEFA